MLKRSESTALRAAVDDGFRWLMPMQNEDGGWPSMTRGVGASTTAPFLLGDEHADMIGVPKPGWTKVVQRAETLLARNVSIETERHAVLADLWGHWTRAVLVGLKVAWRSVTTAQADVLIQGANVSDAAGDVPCPIGFPERAITHVAAATGIAFREAEDHLEALGARNGVVEASGQLRTIACSLIKGAIPANRTVREVEREQKLLSDEDLDRLLDARKMTEPGGTGSAGE